MKLLLWAEATDLGEKRKEDPGEARLIQSPAKGESGSQAHSQACSKKKEKLGSVVIVARGRPGEDNIAGRPGEDNTGKNSTFGHGAKL